MKVSIFGAGYVGLVTGACLADVGNEVVCVDVDEQRVAKLQAGVVPIFEPGLEALIVQNQSAGRLRFTSDVAEAVAHGLFLFIAVGTPPNEDGSADLRHVLQVAAMIGEYIDDYRIVVNKSTVPVGTADKVRAELQRVLDARACRIDFDVASNPEFLKEGAAISDFRKPDRIIIGSDKAEVVSQFRNLYAPFNRSREKIIAMDARSAELTKYASNAMLATKISFMNELANIAERTGADIEHVRLGMGADHRIGYEFIYPGCGYGGSCFPKDVRALSRTAAEVGYETRIIDAVESTNEKQKLSMFRKINAYFNGHLHGLTIAIWGLAFKPNTDDIREAPSCVLIDALCEAGTKIQAYDPQAMKNIGARYSGEDNLRLHEDAISAVVGANALVVLTEWNEFRAFNVDSLKGVLASNVIFDGRNIYDPGKMKALGFDYFGIGRSA